MENEMAYAKSIRSVRARRKSNLLVTAAVGACLQVVGGEPALASDFAELPALQRGAIGPGLAYTDLDGYSATGIVGLSRSYGKEVLNSDPDTRVDGDTMRTRFAAGAALATGGTFRAAAFADSTVVSFSEERKRSTPRIESEGGANIYEIGVNGIARSGVFVFGGGLSLVLVGSEERKFTYGDAAWTTDASSAAMPQLRLTGGLDFGALMGTVGLRLFTEGETSVEAKDGTGNTELYDTMRKRPGIVHVDGRMRFGEQGDIGVQAAWILTGQGSDALDPWSMTYIDDAGSDRRRRDTGEGLRNRNHLRMTFGGRFNPAPDIGVLGALRWEGSSYSEKNAASLEAENLGGIRLSLGSEFAFETLTASLEAAYQTDTTLSYDAPNADRSVTAVGRTQKAPIEAEDRVKITQGYWGLTAGGAWKF